MFKSSVKYASNGWYNPLPICNGDAATEKPNIQNNTMKKTRNGSRADANSGHHLMIVVAHL